MMIWECVSYELAIAITVYCFSLWLEEKGILFKSTDKSTHKGDESSFPNSKNKQRPCHINTSVPNNTNRKYDASYGDNRDGKKLFLTFGHIKRIISKPKGRYNQD
ncbi:hypothetical protein ACFLX0_00725 [Chloroflexota bacterium]